MNIFILEDEKIHSDQLLQHLQQWSSCNDRAISIQCFLRGEDLLTYIKSNPCNIPDIIFIDIKLDGISGMQVAEMLRLKGFQNEIIFTTNYSDFSLKGYDVGALRYLLKPIQYEDIASCMEYFENNSYFYYSYKGGISKILYNEILYFESIGHYIRIKTNRPLDEVITFRHRITDLTNKKLPKRFVQCHRSYIVNLVNSVRVVDQKIELEDGSVITIGKKYLKDVIDKFTKLTY